MDGVEMSIPKLLSDCIVNVCQSYVSFTSNVAVSGHLRFSVDESKYFYINVNEKLKSEISTLLKESSTGVDICECSSENILIGGQGDGHDDYSITSQPKNNLPITQTQLKTQSSAAAGFQSETINVASVTGGIKEEHISDTNADIKPDVISLGDEEEEEEEDEEQSSNIVPTYSQPAQTTATQSLASATDTTSFLRAQAENMYQNMLKKQGGAASNISSQIPQTAQFTQNIVPQNTQQQFASRQYTPRHRTPITATRRGGMRGAARGFGRGLVRGLGRGRQKTTRPSNSFPPASATMTSGQQSDLNDSNSGMEGLDLDTKEFLQQPNLDQSMGDAAAEPSTAKKKRNRTSQYTKKDLQEAILACKSGQMNTTKASQTFNVPRRTLGAYVSGVRSLESGPNGRPPALSPQVEEQIVHALEAASGRGEVMTKKQVLATVGKIAEAATGKAPFKKGVPGCGWWMRFKARHPSFHLKLAEPTMFSHTKSGGKEPELPELFTVKL